MIIKSTFFSILAVFFFNTLGAQNYIPVIINGEVFFKTELETSDGLVLSEVTVANFEKNKWCAL